MGTGTVNIYTVYISNTKTHVTDSCVVSFRQLVLDRQSSPWSLVLTLAYMFGVTVTPSGTFHSLKMALLLSLASCSPKKVISIFRSLYKSDLIDNCNSTLPIKLLFFPLCLQIFYTDPKSTWRAQIAASKTK